MIYLDNAATSGCKPESVYKACDDALRNASGNPGRSGHQVSLKAGSIVYDTRIAVSQLINAENAECIVFGLNATDMLNTAIMGVLRGNEHIITTGMEHNSTARPLEYAKNLGCELTKLETSIDNGVNPEDVRNAIKDNTRLVVINHVSNVTGTVNDIEAIGKICREAGVIFLVDASQSIGTMNIDVRAMNIDLLAFPGHKSLMGPQGTGALYIRPGIEVEPLKRGGTGSRSELLTQPDIMPDKYESGTLNVPGLAGLGEGIRFINSEGLDRISSHEIALTERLVAELGEIPGVTVYAPAIGKRRGAVMSMTLEGMDPQDVSLILDDTFGIAVRAGLHCAPDAHRTMGTLATGGTIRISPGYFSTEEEIEACIEAVKNIAESI